MLSLAQEILLTSAEKRNQFEIMMEHNERSGCTRLVLELALKFQSWLFIRLRAGRRKSPRRNARQRVVSCVRRLGVGCFGLLSSVRCKLEAELLAQPKAAVGSGFWASSGYSAEVPSAAAGFGLETEKRVESSFLSGLLSFFPLWLLVCLPFSVLLEGFLPTCFYLFLGFRESVLGTLKDRACRVVSPFLPSCNRESSQEETLVLAVWLQHTTAAPLAHARKRRSTTQLPKLAYVSFT